MKVNYVVMYMQFYGIGRFKLCHKYFENYEDIEKFINNHNRYKQPRIFEYGIFELKEWKEFNE